MLFGPSLRPCSWPVRPAAVSFTMAATNAADVVEAVAAAVVAAITILAVAAAAEAAEVATAAVAVLAPEANTPVGTAPAIPVATATVAAARIAATIATRIAACSISSICAIRKRMKAAKAVANTISAIGFAAHPRPILVLAAEATAGVHRAHIFIRCRRDVDRFHLDTTTAW